MKEYYKRLIKAKQEFKSVIKDNTAKITTRSGSQYSYQYADLQGVLDAIQPALWANSLDVEQTIIEGILSTDIIDCETGERYNKVSLPIINADLQGGNDIQKLGGGITYLRRYSLMVALGLATEDDDGASANNPVRPVKKPIPPAILPTTQDQLLKLIEVKKEAIKADDYERGLTAIKKGLNLDKIHEWLLKL